MKHEGSQVAAWLNTLGVTAAVLKYRVPSPKGEPPHKGPLLDGQRAMSLLKSRASEWGIETNKIGVLGFSAGGHLAAWLLCEGNRWADGHPETKGPGPKPTFGVFVYPAYLSTPDKNRPAPTIQAEDKPGPAFFVHASDDRLGPENSIEFYLALKKAGVGGEMHIYQKGGHGFGMLREGNPANDWPERCTEWLRSQRLVR
jgi:acetyl esterase/lipase